MTKNAKTRILAIGDIHGDTRLAEKLAERAKKENIDVIILAGDITLAEQSTEGIIGPFAKAKKDVLIIPGNHESISTTAFLSEVYAPYSKHLHGYSFVKNDVGFFGAGTANMGIHQVTDEEIFKALERGNSKLKKVGKKVMVTHIHPYGSKAEMFGFRGSNAVRRAITEFRPDILIDAHIHPAGGMEEKIEDTLVFNVSKRERIFEI